MPDRDERPEGADSPGSEGPPSQPATPPPPSPADGGEALGFGPPAGVPGGFGAEPETPSAGARTAKVTALITAIVVALGAGAIAVVLRSADRGASLEQLVPAEAIMFGRATISPSGDQRANLNDILAKFPKRDGKEVPEQIEDLLNEGFAEEGLSFTDDIKPWVGAEIGFAVYRLSFGGDTPEVRAAALLSVRDEGAARDALTKMKRRSGDFVFEVMQDAAFIAPDQASLSAALRVINDGVKALPENREYRLARDRVGADSLGLFWMDAAALGGVIPPGLPRIPGADLTGTTIVGVRARENALEMKGFGAGMRKSPVKPGKPALVEGSPAEQLGSMTLFDPATIFEQILEAFGLFSGFAASESFTATQEIAYQPAQEFDFPSPREQAEEFLQQFLGLSLENDVLPWLHGELSIVIGGFSSGPIPDVGVLIEPTHEGAAQRTMQALRERLGFLGASMGFDVAPAPGGFAVTFVQGFSIIARRTEGRVVIASNDAYADELLGASSAKLADDAVYRATVGRRSDDVAFQMFVRMDKLTRLLQTFLPTSEYDQAGPYLEPIQAVGMRATVAGDESTFRLVVTFK